MQPFLTFQMACATVAVVLPLAILGSVLALGLEAPAFDLERVDGAGGRASLNGYRGKVVVLDFWTTWCRPCVQMVPLLAELSRSYERDLQIVGINGDQNRTADEIGKFVRAHGMDYPVVADPDRRVQDPYGVVTYPRLVLIDRDGNVRQVIRGYGPRMREPIRAAVRRLIESGAAAAAGPEGAGPVPADANGPGIEEEAAAAPGSPDRAGQPNTKPAPPSVAGLIGMVRPHGGARLDSRLRGTFGGQLGLWRKSSTGRLFLGAAVGVSRWSSSAELEGAVVLSRLHALLGLSVGVGRLWEPAHPTWGEQATLWLIQIPLFPFVRVEAYGQRVAGSVGLMLLLPVFRWPPGNKTGTF
jgi:thiol-disulfide isomerase/thioredoxin